MSENRGGRASEQLGRPDKHAKHTQVGGGKFLNLHALRLNLEPSGASETNYSHQ